MASAILVVGGTPMMPGFIPRLHAEIARALSPPLSPHLQSSTQRKGRIRPPPYDRYAPLRQLLPHFAILNDPDPPKENRDPALAQKKSSAGKAPAFTPACMAWVGGSLAGYVVYLSRSTRHVCSSKLITHSRKVVKNRGRRNIQREMGRGGSSRGSRDR